jgi:Fibrinogen beta and gamma chains, C-terminal globular domain
VLVLALHFDFYTLIARTALKVEMNRKSPTLLYLTSDNACNMCLPCLGNYYINRLTTSGQFLMSLRIDVIRADNSTQFVKYSNFSIADDTMAYQLRIGSFLSGDATGW